LLCKNISVFGPILKCIRLIFVLFLHKIKNILPGFDTKFVHGAPGGSARVKLAMNANRQVESKSAFCRSIVLTNVVYAMNSFL